MLAHGVPERSALDTPGAERGLDENDFTLGAENNVPEVRRYILGNLGQEKKRTESP